MVISAKQFANKPFCKSLLLCCCNGALASLLPWPPLCLVQGLQSARIKEVRLTLRGIAATAAQLMSRTLELLEIYILHFPDLLQTDLVQHL